MEDEQTGTWIPYEYSRLTNIYNPPIYCLVIWNSYYKTKLVKETIP